MTNSGSKDWARRLVAEYEGGRPPKPTNVYRVAYEALGLVFPEGAQLGEQAQQALLLVPDRPTTAVPVPKHAPQPWWGDDEPAVDSN